MECPQCRRINPETAQRCDCGHDFTTKTLEEPYAEGPLKKLFKGPKGLGSFFVLSGGLSAIISIVAALMWSGGVPIHLVFMGLLFFAIPGGLMVLAGVMIQSGARIGRWVGMTTPIIHPICWFVLMWITPASEQAGRQMFVVFYIVCVGLISLGVSTVLGIMAFFSALRARREDAVQLRLR